MRDSMLEEVTIKDIPESFRDIAEVIGIDAYKKLVRYVGGSTVYVPVEGCLTREVRNRVLKESFNGDYKSVTRKYNISEAHVRRIINQQ